MVWCLKNERRELSKNSHKLELEMKMKKEQNNDDLKKILKSHWKPGFKLSHFSKKKKSYTHANYKSGLFLLKMEKKKSWESSVILIMYSQILE